MEYKNVFNGVRKWFLIFLQTNLKLELEKVRIRKKVKSQPNILLQFILINKRESNVNIR